MRKIHKKFPTPIGKLVTNFMTDFMREYDNAR